jgi:4'-phosphopantetheinyl transferase
MEDVRVWLIDVRREQPAVDVLSAEERHRAERFRFEADRRRYVVAHARLREVLAAFLGADPAALQFDAGQHGKPSLRDSEIEFSLSHSGDLVAIAVSPRQPVGIDVERITTRANLLEVAGDAFNAAERAWLYAQPDTDRAFFRLWTIKEAAMKADGTGLGLPLDQVTIDVKSLCTASLRVRVRNEPWRARELEIDGYAGTVVTRPR